MRVAVASSQVAKHLVVSAVFFDDVDHVLDVFAELRHLELGGSFLPDRAPMIILGHLAGQLLEVVARRHGKRQQARLHLLENVLIRGVTLRVRMRPKRSRCPAGLRIRPGIAEGVYHVECPAVGAGAHRRRVPARGNQSNHPAFRAAILFVIVVRGALFLRLHARTAQRNHGDIVSSAVGGQEHPLVIEKLQAVRAASFPSFAVGERSQRRGRQDRFHHAVAGRINHRHAVGAVQGHIKQR